MNPTDASLTATPTLDDCASEPIHIPGAIQPHGALLVFEDGRLIAWSDNVPAYIGAQPTVGADVASLGLGSALERGLSDLLAPDALDDAVPITEALTDEAAEFVRTAHRYDGRVLVEFERPPSDLVRANLAARMFGRIKVASDRDQLLAMCCDEIRSWTGFDRVMAYVFHDDGSGEVVAESRSARIDSFLNMRFPASDIPDQARRLYVLNTLRFIPDVGYRPVALRSRADAGPIDLSFAALRSVSPIHIEYLGNMGVNASMSVSIVIDGRLWGLFACHHNEPLLVGPSTRQTCDMLAHFVASRVQALQSIEMAERFAESALLTGRIAHEYAGTDDALQYLASIEGEIREILRVDGLLIASQGKLLSFGGAPLELGHRIVAHACLDTETPFVVDSRANWPDALREAMGDWVGAIKLDFDPASNGVIVGLRREQIKTVKWSGEPTKTYATGPNGPRLTPRGSFAEWRQTVVGRSAPWKEVTVRIANTLQNELLRVTAMRHAEIEQARRHLLAMLGHDLRDPLQAIRMAAHILQRNEGSKSMATSIDNSSSRMQRLIGQILDFSRAEAGMHMLSRSEDVDLAELMDALVEESQIGHPGVTIAAQIQRPARFRGDAGRIAQAIGNLLSNARHHAEPGSTVEVSLQAEDGAATIVVSNVARPIADDVAAALFEPLKRMARVETNRTGLGLGLYIAHRIAVETNGEIAYRHIDGRVVFTLVVRSA